MAASRTNFYLDKQNRKWLGVCSGIADYTGVDVTWVRVGTVILTLLGGFPWTLIAYWATAWIADDKPNGLYEDKEAARGQVLAGRAPIANAHHPRRPL